MSNCDGIDGTVTAGMFVATAAAGAGRQRNLRNDDPSVQDDQLRDHARAASAALRYVYVQAGVYNEEVVLFNGVDVVGGYDVNCR